MEVRLNGRGTKAVRVLLALILCLGLMPTMALGDDGSEEVIADLQISTLAELEEFRDNVNNGNSYEDMLVELTDDIDMSGSYGTSGSSWTPIGTSSASFQGTFDGNGYTISGLYINSSSNYQGLFGYVDGGTIENLVVSGEVISEGSNTGGVVGYGDEVTLTNVGNEANVTSTGANTGGVIGCMNSGSITASYNKGAVTGAEYTGGIEGWGYYANSHSVYACYNLGNVVTTSSMFAFAYAGGISGLHGMLYNCYNAGNVSAINVASASFANSLVAYMIRGATTSPNYYLYGTGYAGVYQEGVSGVSIVKTADEMADDGFVDTMNEGADAAGLDSGIWISVEDTELAQSQSTPALYWEITEEPLQPYLDNDDSYTLEEGETVSFEYTGDGELTVESSNEGIATVSFEGSIITIAAIGEGSAIVTVSASAGSEYAELETVSIEVIVESVDDGSDGSSSGDDSGSGSGDDDGSGTDDGNGSDSGSDDGSGSGSDDSDGSGSSDDDGSGTDDGDGSDSGSGDGSGSGTDDSDGSGSSDSDGSSSGDDGSSADDSDGSGSGSGNDDGSGTDDSDGYGVFEYFASIDMGKTGVIENTDDTPLLLDAAGNLVNTNVTVVSADESIATASFEDGVLTIVGVAEGTTTITVSSPDAANVAEIEVTVMAATSFTLVDNGTGVTASQPTGGDNIPVGADIVLTITPITSGDSYDTLVDGYVAEDLIEVYEVTLTVDGVEIHDGFGSLALTFPADGYETVYVYHLTVDGDVQKSTALTVADGAVTVEVDSLSTFAVAADSDGTDGSGTTTGSDDGTDADKTSSDLSKTGDGSMYVLWGAFGTLVALAFVTVGFARQLRCTQLAIIHSDHDGDL